MLRLICVFLSCDLPILLLLLKLLSSTQDDILVHRSLSSCVDLHHKLQHFMLEQIELHFFSL